MKTILNSSLVLAAALLLDSRVNPACAASVIASRPQQISLTGGGHSVEPLFSADGRYVVFVSEARNLATNDTSSLYLLNVYARDLASSNTILVSVNLSGVGAGDDGASAPGVSANGRFIAFESAASNLVANDTNRVSDVFMRDQAGGTTTLVSVESSGLQSGNGASVAPLISADGRWVIFESAASNLGADDTNDVADVFARDLQSGSTVLVSADTTAAGAASGPAESASITPDGQTVAFIKRATNEVGGVSSRAEVYVRNLQTGTTTWASSGAASYFESLTNSYRCSMPILSANGRYVVFSAGELQFGQWVQTNSYIFRRDLQTDVLTLVGSNVPGLFVPQVSADGRFVAYPSESGVLLWDAVAGTNVAVCGCGPGGDVIENCHAPVMTPDGNRIAFIGSEGGQPGVYLYDRPSGCSQLVSVNTNGTASAPVAPSLPAISDDGRFVAFESLASDLVAGDLNQSGDVFLRDVNAGTTQLISQRAPALPPATGARSMRLWPNSVSADGRFVAFTSTDNGLAADDTNPWQDVFVRDVQTSITVLASRLETGQPALTQNYFSYPVLNANGRYLAHVSYGWGGLQTNITWTDLTTGQRRTVSIGGESISSPSGFGAAISPEGRYLAFQDGPWVFMRNMEVENGTNELLALTQSGYSSTSPRFSPDGRWVSFLSDSYQLVTNRVQGLGYPQVYVRDLVTRKTRLASYNPNGSGLFTRVTNHTFSADSRHVFFHATVSNTVPGVYRHDLLANTTNLTVCRACKNPSPSADGRLVAFETVRGSYDAVNSSITNDVFVVDTATGQSNLVSVNLSGTGGGNGSSCSPLLSHDGRYVVFTSKASDLVPNDNNNATDIFVRDLRNGTTMLVSLNGQGTGSGNAQSDGAIMAADGRTVFFQSFASDLAAGDYNRTRDIFMVKLGGPDTDGDAMDDDWEMACFSTLSRDGAGDFDSDGASDLAEFNVGTDPTNLGSIFRVITITSLGGGQRSVLWSAVPGRTYRVQFKNSVDDVEWSELPDLVTTSGTTASATDSTSNGNAHRFYRVLAVQ